ncbi:hypothetical protein L917_07978 [Phytophthora nicotianae]|uniref:Uncharacterized protein n=1 Tax=Phytophthora nicotianae TaxID=4792 RepID=W2FLC3_PHYNI|nr:hypothetical protein L915_21822 [Phytophthora nicotianae]ETL93987.1 hypothetical protein L917_07978 [Phytophthora nicotianae]
MEASLDVILTNEMGAPSPITHHASTAFHVKSAIKVWGSLHRLHRITV